LEKIVEKRTKDLKIAKEKAEESDRLKSTFLANMSHEIRTPMNAIIGFTSLLNNPGLSDEVKRELTVHINHNSDTLLRLIDDIIDLSKIEAEQLYIEKKSCSVDKIFDTLLKVFNEKKIEIKKDHIIFKIAKNNQNKNLKIYTDFIRFRQIYSNLLSNSLKFTEEGEIEIGYTQSEAENIFYVKDTGIGLSDEQKDLIFERFSKIENHKQKMYRGAGLGLAISKNLIELLGGRIWVNSEKDKGSIFYFTIPFSNLA
jgi:signal transduction histidine kinase